MAEKKLEARSTESVFMRRDLYRDEKNHPDDPAIIERKFSQLEAKASVLLKEKILDKNPVVLTRAELELIRIFLFLLSFRAEYRMRQYRNGDFDQDTKERLSKSAVGGDFEDLWKRENEAVLDCESYGKIQESERIDEFLKLDILNELKGYYMTLADARGGDFLISDVYPTLEIFPVSPDGRMKAPMHVLFPVSPSRILILNHILFKKETRSDAPMKTEFESVSRIKGQLVEEPSCSYKRKGASGTLFSPDDLFTYHVGKVYESDVEYINALFLNEAKTGIAFRDWGSLFRYRWREKRLFRSAFRRKQITVFP
jgi:hypothetical protein